MFTFFTFTETIFKMDLDIDQRSYTGSTGSNMTECMTFNSSDRKHKFDDGSGMVIHYYIKFK